MAEMDWDGEITFWGQGVCRLAARYNPEDDVIIATPVDHEGQERPEGSIAFEAAAMDRLLKLLDMALSRCAPDRRVLRKARSKGADVEAVLERLEEYEAASLADALVRGQQGG